MTSVIFTADDFGAIPSIDQGIITAVKAGKINSVAAFANSPRSLSSVKHLMREAEKAGKQIELGCHLTITSGKPLTKGVKWLTKRGHFRKFGDFKRPYPLDKMKCDALFHELEMQVKTFTDADIDVKHLSVHHGSLTWFPDFTRLLLELGKKHNIPVRSPYFIPEKENNLYLKIITHLTKLNIPLELSLVIENFRKNYRDNISKMLKPYGDQVTSATDSSHYGPIALRAFSQKSIKLQSEKKQENFIQRLHNQKPDSTVEYMFHLIEDDFKNLNKYKKEAKRGKNAYKGIDRNYYDSRMIEIKALMNMELPQGVKMVNWR